MRAVLASTGRTDVASDTETTEAGSAASQLPIPWAERDDAGYWQADFHQPRTARARHWLGQVSSRFLALFGELHLVGRFSNGEAVFERADIAS